MKKVTTSMIKCAYGYNYYRLRNTMINNDIVEAHCSRCNQVETQNYVIKYKEMMSLRKEFIKDLVIVLVKNKPEDICIEVIM